MSLSGAGVVRDEPQLIEKAVLEYVERLRREHPEIVRVRWFGSRVTGRATRSSDVDLCLILSSSSEPFLERSSRYHPGRFPTGIDLFVYTEAEWTILQETSPSWVREVVSGRDL